MAVTTTDYASILASALGFAVAIHGVLSQPIVADSTRPRWVEDTRPRDLERPALARLWDDPFAVFPDAPERNLNCARHDGNALFLIVPLQTHPYQDSSEQRVRTRYAVQRALLDAGYAPTSPLILFSLPAGPNPKTRIPYQVFNPDPLNKDVHHAKYNNVVLLWLPDQLLSNARDANAFSPFAQQKIPTAIFGNPIGNKPQENAFAVLGPADSDGLIDLLKKTGAEMTDTVVQSQQVTNKEILTPAPTEIVCPRATISDNLLGAITGRELSKRQPGQPILIDPNDNGQQGAGHGLLRVYRYGPEDDAVCEKLAEEVIRRARMLPDRPVKVWVLSEQDTVYGRALARSFHDALENRGVLAKGVAGSIAKNSNPAFPNALIRLWDLPYLRGIDGTSSLYAPPAPTSSPTGDSKSQTPMVETAEGTTQFDYFRRITDATWAGTRLFSPVCVEPDAVVIFGSDVYDKLVLLKFLRQRLKVPTFFTTDLDALFWHPHYQGFTKDLVVASGFSNNVSTEFPPKSNIAFRDCYQVGAYEAVSSLTRNDRDVARDCVNASKAALYKIGANAAHRLPDPLSKRTPASARPVPDVVWTVVSPMGTLSAGLHWVVATSEDLVILNWPFFFQLTVLALAAWALVKNIPSRTLLPAEVRNELWRAAATFIRMPGSQDPLWLLAGRIRQAFNVSSTRREPMRRPRYFPDKSRFAPNGISLGSAPPGREAEVILEHYGASLNAVTYRSEVWELGLALLSDLFTLRRHPLPDQINTNRFEPDLLPFANYCAREFRLRPYSNCVSIEEVTGSPDSLPTGRELFTPSNRRRFSGWLPSCRFLFFVVPLVMLIFISMQSRPFFVGLSDRPFSFRIGDWLLQTVSLLLTFLVFHRVCFEQWRFRKLIGDLSALIKSPTGLSNRKILLLIVEASKPVTFLAITPCALTFLLFLAHLHALGGSKAPWEILIFLAVLLIMLGASYFELRNAAIDARENVIKRYRDESVRAARLTARLKSYADDAQPLQDDETSLQAELKSFVEECSTMMPELRGFPAYERISEKDIRTKLCEYLRSCSERASQAIAQIEAVQSGLFSSLPFSPIFSALLIPVGGAGGISLVQALAAQFR